MVAKENEEKKESKPGKGETGDTKAQDEKTQRRVTEGVEERSSQQPDEEVKAAPPEEAESTGQETPTEPETAGDEELSEEELRRSIEESLEKVTVADIILNMMNQLASVAYLKMGLPESVNLKYRDLDQARLAIDTLEAMVKGAEARVQEDALRPFRTTLANLQLNFVQLKEGKS